jgi:ABC-type glycerol-3-phosphate transport system substrate-binding protein
MRQQEETMPTTAIMSTRPTRRALILGTLGTLGTLAVAGAGCGGAPAEQTAGASKTPVSLRYVHQWGAPFTPQLDKILADFTARNPTVKAEAVRTSGEIHEALVKALAGGEPPDLTMMWRNNMPGFGAKNGLTVLDPYLARDKFDRGMYYENELKSSQFLGKTYALPAAAAGAWYLLFYNQAHFREAGLDVSRPPQTWDEVTRYAAQLLKRGGDGRIERIGFDPGAYDAGTFNSFFTAWLMANGGKYSSDDGRKLLFDGPQATGALDWTLQVLRGNGGKDPVAEFFGRARKNTHQALITGERAMYVTNHSLPSNAVLVPELQYGIGLLPRGNQNGARGIVRGGWSNAIPRGVPAAHESWLLLQYLCASREGGGWFMEQQVRPSPIKAVNESPALKALPHWDVIKQALATDTLAPTTPMDPEIDKLTAKAMLDVYAGTAPREAVSFAQREGQRLLDEFWAGVGPK